jgi:hypothetical protein
LLFTILFCAGRHVIGAGKIIKFINLKKRFMKKQSLFKRALYVSLLLGVVLIMSCNKDDDNPDNRPYTVTGDANGAQMVPAVSGTGTGTFNGTYDPASGTLTYTSNWNGLTGAPTSGGFYNGASGSAGTAAGSPWTIPANSTGTGTYSGTMQLTGEQASQMLGGNWYYSYGTGTNPGGEVRGQMSATR